MPSENPGLLEAVPIVGAIACAMADQMAVRALLIKGAPATAMRVRSSRPSIDVDVWVAPDGFDRYVERLSETGWKRYAGLPDVLGWGHAVTMTHPEWSCTIDVHRRFPGFLTDDGTAFEQAWQTHNTTRVAHQDVAVPSRVVAAAITVLHAARSTTIVGTDDDLACALATARAFSSRDRDELSRLVAATGSAEPLAALLVESGCQVPASSAPDADRLDEWRVRLRVGVSPGSRWLLALRAASWPQRVGILVAALQPGAKDYAESGADHSARGSVRAALYRWQRSARLLPDAIRAVRGAVPARPR